MLDIVSDMKVCFHSVQGVEVDFEKYGSGNFCGASVPSNATMAGDTFQWHLNYAPTASAPSVGVFHAICMILRSRRCDARGRDVLQRFYSHHFSESLFIILCASSNCPANSSSLVSVRIRDLAGFKFEF